jgi:hypothetical protein
VEFAAQRLDCCRAELDPPRPVGRQKSLRSDQINFCPPTAPRRWGREVRREPQEGGWCRLLKGGLQLGRADDLNNARPARFQLRIRSHEPALQ